MMNTKVFAKNAVLFLISALTLSWASFAVSAEVKNNGEAGIVLTTGNTETTSYNLKETAEFIFSPHKVQFDGAYLQAEQSDIVSAEKWLLGLRYERDLDEKWTLFVAQSAEGDRFAGFNPRYNSDVGGKHFFYRLEKDFIWLAELGLRYTTEHGTDDTVRRYQKGRLYTEVEDFWSETTSTKFWVEYVPNFTTSRAWLLNGEASVSSALTTIFSIKSSYLVKYSNIPLANTTKRTDTSFTTALVAKF